MKCCIRCKKGDIAAAVTGLAAGFVNGLLGAGGGMILVPMLHLWCGLDEKEACATSVAVVAPMCALSAILYFAGGSAWPPQTLWYCAGGLAGGFFGGLLLGKLPTVWLMRGFSGLMIVAGVRLLT